MRRGLKDRELYVTGKEFGGYRKSKLNNTGPLSHKLSKGDTWLHVRERENIGGLDRGLRYTEGW